MFEFEMNGFDGILRFFLNDFLVCLWVLMMRFFGKLDFLLVDMFFIFIFFVICFCVFYSWFLMEIVIYLMEFVVDKKWSLIL